MSKSNITTKKFSENTVRYVGILYNEAVSFLTRQGETLSSSKKRAATFVTILCGGAKSELVYIVKDTFIEARKKTCSIQNDYLNGATFDQLAFKYNLSERRIRDIAAESKTGRLPVTRSAAIAPMMMIGFTRMLMNIGIEQEDAVNAARGFWAVIVSKLGGSSVIIPSARYSESIINQLEIVKQHKAGKSNGQLAVYFKIPVEDIQTIINNYPPEIIPDYSELPKIRTSLFNMAYRFNDYTEINTLFGKATEYISRAESIIAALEQRKGDLNNVK